MSAESNVVNLQGTASAIRGEFIAWQCALRKQAMRQAGGRPSEGMCPRVIDPSGRVIAGAMTVLLAHVDPQRTAALFEFQYKRTQDPLDRYEKAVASLSADYYQHPRNFTGELSALFAGGVPVVRALVDSRHCVLVFQQYSHEYRLPCDVEVLAPEDARFKATYWHNAMFNPNLPPAIDVVSFAPDWTHAAHLRT